MAKKPSANKVPVDKIEFDNRNIPGNVKNVKKQNGLLNQNSKLRTKKHTAWTDTNLLKIYKIMQDFVEHGVDIHCPQFLIIGGQSSGKTSLESQLIQMPIGVMKDGTGTRQVTRLKMTNNLDLSPGVLKIKCNGQSCANEEELSAKILEKAKCLEESKTIEDSILEVEIEGSDIPEITFVDSIGLMDGDKKEDEELRKKIDGIVGRLLNETDLHGNPKYCPVIIVKAEDTQNINDSINKRIDKIINDNPNSDGFIFKDWIINAVFIVNKIDLKTNFKNCDEWITTFNKYKQHYRKLIITMANPDPNSSTATMDSKELADFVKSVPKLEHERWELIKAKYRGDEKLDEFNDYIKKYCGLKLMRRTFGKMMTDKVSKSLDTLEMKINQAVIFHERQLQKIEKDIVITQPNNLIKTISDFTNELITNLASIYKGELFRSVSDDAQNFQADLNDIFKSDSYLRNKKARIWKKKYFRNLKFLKDNLQEAGDTKALAEIDYKFHSGESIYRLERLWSRLVALMPMPQYSDEEIRLGFNRYKSTRSGDPFDCLRNILFQSCQDLENATYFLAESVRVLIEKNLKNGFDYTYKKFYANEHDDDQYFDLDSESELKDDEVKLDIDQDNYNLNNNKNNENSKNLASDFNYNLLSISLKQLRKQNDLLIKSLLDRFSHIQHDLTEILTKHKPSIITNIGKFFEKILNEEIARLKLDESKQNEKQQTWTDKQFYKEVYSQKCLKPLYIPNEDINTIKRLGRLYWLLLKDTTIRFATNCLSSEVIQHLNSKKVYIQAVHKGAVDVKVDYFIQKLNQLTNIPSSLLKKSVMDLDKTGVIEPGLLSLDPDSLAKACNIDYDSLVTKRDIMADNLHKLKNKKQKGLAQIEILRHN